MLRIEVDRIRVIFSRHRLSARSLEEANRPGCVLARDRELHLAATSVVGVRTGREYDPRLDALGMESLHQGGQRLGTAFGKNGLVWRIRFHASILSSGANSTPLMPQASIEIFPDARVASALLADELVALVAQQPETVLGLPTGGTPRELYAAMVRAYDAGRVSWSQVRSFNLDEYWPMAPSHPQSFARFMREQLFEPAHFDPSRTHIPSGEVAPESIALHCAAYETAIRAAGGIQLQVLGIGLNGHLGFNEPGASREGRTDLVELAASTRERAAAAFSPEAVPSRGITMGLGTILESEQIVVLAFGAEKADAVAAAIEGPVDEACPGSLLQEHAQVRWLLDEAAASGLSDANSA